MRHIQHVIVGKVGRASRQSDTYDCNDGGIQGKVYLGDAVVLETAVQSAIAAQSAWAATNPQRCARNRRAIQILFGHSRIENTVRYLGVDMEGALILAEDTEI